MTALVYEVVQFVLMTVAKQAMVKDWQKRQ